MPTKLLGLAFVVTHGIRRGVVGALEGSLPGGSHRVVLLRNLIGSNTAHCYQVGVLRHGYVKRYLILRLRKKLCKDVGGFLWSLITKKLSKK